MFQRDEKIIILTVLYAILTIFCLGSFLGYYTVSLSVSRSSLMLFMIITHIMVANKVNYYFLACQCFSVIADFLQFYDVKYFFYTVVFYSIAHVFFILALSYNVKKKYLKTLIFNFLPFILLTLIIVEIVLVKSNHSKILFYVLLILQATTVSIAITNYTIRMVRYNLLLLLGCLFSILISYLTSINLENLQQDFPLLIAVTLTVAIANYFCCIGFLDKDKSFFQKEIKTL